MGPRRVCAVLPRRGRQAQRTVQGQGTGLAELRHPRLEGRRRHGATRTFVLVSQPQIASVQALKGKRLYLPQQDSLRSCIARGMLDQARMSLKDLGKVEFQNTRGAGLNALGLGATDATVAESSEAEKWLAANPGKGRVLLTSRETPAGLAVLSHKSVAADLQAKIARWATAPEGVLPGQPGGTALGQSAAAQPAWPARVDRRGRRYRLRGGAFPCAIWRRTTRHCAYSPQY